MTNQNNLKIDSSYYNEHTKELQLYVGDAIHCTMSMEYEPEDWEVDDIIADIEYEQYRENKENKLKLEIKN